MMHAPAANSITAPSPAAEVVGFRQPLQSEHDHIFKAGRWDVIIARFELLNSLWHCSYCADTLQPQMPCRLWYRRTFRTKSSVQLRHCVAYLHRLCAPLKPCSYLEMKERDAQLKQSEAPGSSKDQGTQTESDAAGR